MDSALLVAIGECIKIKVLIINIVSLMEARGHKLVDTHRWSNNCCFVVLGMMSGMFTVIPLYQGMIGRHTSQDNALQLDSNSSSYLNKSVLLCWIVTHPNNTNTRIAALRSTWTKRCDFIVYFSSEENKTIPIVKLEVREGRIHLADKTMSALRHLYFNYYDKADWFFKADDDTYVIVENLRHFMSKLDRSQPYYYGEEFHLNNQSVYNSGGAGYLMGKEALKKIALHSIANRCIETAVEDLEVGRCFRKLGIEPGNAKDRRGRPIFNWCRPSKIINGDYPKWTFRRTYSQKGKDAVCPVSATFHYVYPKHMKTIDFLLYNLTVYGITS